MFIFSNDLWYLAFWPFCLQAHALPFHVFTAWMLSRCSSWQRKSGYCSNFYFYPIVVNALASPLRELDLRRLDTLKMRDTFKLWGLLREASAYIRRSGVGGGRGTQNACAGWDSCHCQFGWDLEFRRAEWWHVPSTTSFPFFSVSKFHYNIWLIVSSFCCRSGHWYSLFWSSAKVPRRFSVAYLATTLCVSLFASRQFPYQPSHHGNPCAGRKGRVEQGRTKHISFCLDFWDLWWTTFLFNQNAGEIYTVVTVGHTSSTTNGSQSTFEYISIRIVFC